MYKKGTIILVPFPFTDLTGNKVRPAVIISKEKSGSDIVVVFITSKQKLKEKYLVPLIPTKENGIKTRSHIVCGKIATLDTKIILGELGQLCKSELELLNKTLRSVLDL